MPYDYLIMDLMKNIGKIACILHCFIMVMCIYAVLCCGFHILPTWGCSEHYESINNTLLSIALSYISGYLIYLFTSELPRKQREREVFLLWSSNLTELYNAMSELIESVRVFAGISREKMSALTDNDVKQLSFYASFEPTIYIKKTTDQYMSGEAIVDDFNIKKELNLHYDIVHKYLDSMLNNPMAVDAEKKLLDVLSRVKTSSFLVECTRVINKDKIKEGLNIETPELPKAYIKYVGLRDKLKEWPFSKSKYEFYKLTKDEIDELIKSMEEQLNKMGTTPKEMNELEQMISNAAKMG